MTREERVAEFNKAAGSKTASEGGEAGIQVACFAEELQEFDEAMSSYMLEPTVESREAFVKEWADVQYTLSNLAWFFGINGEEVFKKVSDNNMTKVVDGKVLRRADGKVLKPLNYKKCCVKGF